jgi:hypothetical protein
MRQTALENPRYFVSTSGEAVHLSAHEVEPLIASTAAANILYWILSM